MHIEDVRQALHSLDSDVLPSWGEITAIPGDRSYWSFAVEPGCIFRFPRHAAIADCLRSELRLLSELAGHVSFQVPQFEWLGLHSGLPFAG